MDDHGNPLSRWLAAERSGRTQWAEAALGELFSVLAQPAPGAGFAEGVMARLTPMRPVEKIALGWRLTLAACLMLAALSVAALPVILMPLVELARVSELMQLVATGLVGGSLALADWLSFWHSLVEVNRVLMTVVSKPPVAAILIVVAGLTAISFRLFADLMTTERSTHHG